jgi:hypothetical protein
LLLGAVDARTYVNHMEGVNNNADIVGDDTAWVDSQ